MSNEIDEIVQFDQEEQKSLGNTRNCDNNNEASAAAPTDLQINVETQDYTDVAMKKQAGLSIDNQNSFLTDTQPQKSQEAALQAKSTSMKKIENKLQRLADLGDINATK